MTRNIHQSHTHLPMLWISSRCYVSALMEKRSTVEQCVARQFNPVWNVQQWNSISSKHQPVFWSCFLMGKQSVLFQSHVNLTGNLSHTSQVPGEIKFSKEGCVGSSFNPSNHTRHTHFNRGLSMRRGWRGEAANHREDCFWRWTFLSNRTGVGLKRTQLLWCECTWRSFSHLIIHRPNSSGD